MSETYTRAELEQAIDNARRLERAHQAIHLWGLVEDSEEGPTNAYERGADMAYQTAAAYLLADVSRAPWAGDNSKWDLVASEASIAGLDTYPDLVDAAQGMTGITTDRRTGEVDRAVEAARAARSQRFPLPEDGEPQ
ncbi:hypothetical protein [Nocardia sp. NPDC057440]|uniref:hypothetical protein n=1 Tax=Nocardia sp. NPDC057440 TaxID=3346134 RepID=UPI00366D4276